MWLLRTDSLGPDRMLRCTVAGVLASVRTPGLCPGRYSVTAWDTVTGASQGVGEIEHDGTGALSIMPPPITTDLALAVRRLGDTGVSGTA